MASPTLGGDGQALVAELIVLLPPPPEGE